MSPVLMWFRSDLRVQDNTALAAAARRGPVIGVFLHCPTTWQRHGHGANKLDFWRRGVAALGERLAALNIPLLQRQLDGFHQAPETLLALAREHGAQALHFNHEYPLDEQRRDARVVARFQADGRRAVGHHDAVAYAPGELRTGQGDYYRVFSPFRRAWLRALSGERLALHDAPPPQAPLGLASDPLPPAAAQHPPVDAARWPAGEQAAAQRLSRFIRERGADYAQRRDFPAQPATSELSPYLALGMLSHRQCLQAALNANGGLLADGDRGLVAWVSELIWREFYQHVAVGFPEVCRHRAFQPHTEALAWRDDAAGFAAWCEGRTGYPIVDAAMRQLLTTGWMHNRLRMIAAMFLSKHLLIDWRRGEAFFLRHLIDGEFCANNGGWQWAASTGTDAAPYFRLFNPTSQAQRFDPEGECIAAFVPELAALPARQRHDPPPAVRRQLGYPAPIVEHAAARQRALDAFKALGDA